MNVGQLLRERNDDEAVALVGFGTHRGEVVAGEEWGAPWETMGVPPAREGSYGDAFPRVGVGDALVFADEVDPAGALAGPRGHRAIGVVYHPDREWGNYVPTALPERYDAFLHVEETGPLHPVDATADEHEPPDAYLGAVIRRRARSSALGRRPGRLSYPARRARRLPWKRTPPLRWR